MGTVTAFEAFFRAEHPKLVAFAWALTGDPDAAGELAQEALLRAYRDWAKVGDYDNPGGCRTFTLPGRPATPFPVMDLALTTPGISDGAVLLSAAGEPAYVLDLSDGSVTEVQGFVGTLTFSAMSPG